jgi:hypothetical protein
VQLGLENKKQTMWAAVLGVVAILALAYEVIPMFMGSSTATASTESTVPPPAATHAPARPGTKGNKKPHVENLDPTLRLDLLAASEQTQYEGRGINIFVSQREEVVIGKPVAPVRTDLGPNGGSAGIGYSTPTISAPPPIPLKFYGFASTVGAAKEDISEVGRRGCICRGRRRNRGPPLQSNSHHADLGFDSGHGVQRSAAEHPAHTGMKIFAMYFSSQTRRRFSRRSAGATTATSC